MDSDNDRFNVLLFFVLTAFLLIVSNTYDYGEAKKKLRRIKPIGCVYYYFDFFLILFV